MNLKEKIQTLINDPIEFYLKALHKFSSQALWRRYSSICRSKGLDTLTFILSFDCDTDEDIKVVGDVHQRLLDMGVKPVYAVPGTLLMRGEKIYSKIFQTNAEFINHGGREHTYFDINTNAHASCFFYHEQAESLLEKDIQDGHKILQSVLGIQAKGWRTPHFGTFQEKQHINFLYSVLKKLNYTFSTSTVPMVAYKKGSIFQQKGIIEIPVSGMFTEPFNILDTWGFFASPLRTHNSKDYRRECEMLSNFAFEHPMLINIYADPSHIYDQPDFFEGIRVLSKHANNLNYSEFLEGI